MGSVVRSRSENCWMAESSSNSIGLSPSFVTELIYQLVGENCWDYLPRSRAAVKEVKIESCSTSSPALLTLSVKLVRLSLEVLVTNWMGSPRPRTKETASDTPGSSWSPTWTVPERSNIRAEIFRPAKRAICTISNPVLPTVTESVEQYFEQ